MTKLIIDSDKKLLKDVTNKCNIFKKYIEKNQKSEIIYKKYLVIKMLLEGEKYTSIQKETGFCKSMIYKLAKSYSTNKDNFYMDNRSKKSKLNKIECDIIDLFDKEKVPSSLSDACNILYEKYGISCSKSSMKEFLDRTKRKNLIIKDKIVREKKQAKIEDDNKNEKLHVSSYKNFNFPSTFQIV